ncbi:MAG: NADH-quinone oxidoreductase subunit NuoG [Syntrophobacteraceae bacterium]
MATIYIDDRPFEAEEGQNLLDVCLSLGFNIPYFCWHPVLGSVGACRQCAVKHFRNEKDVRGEIVMACMTPVEDSIRISIDDPEAVAFRANVLEWLMLNHPHDCPVCDEGGECHLQDMTVMTGHVYRETRFRKRTYPNQQLGPFLNHEMNRCIQCYRCVRYYREYARCGDLNVFASHDHVYFGRSREGTLTSEFSGNLVEICPTGVFTDKSFKKHYTRKWDLQTAPSVCIHCSLGCNTIPGSRYGELRRIRNRYNHEVNGYFLCDRGRYGYEFVNSSLRVREPLLRGKGVPAEEALGYATAMISEGEQVIGIGSPRASVESNFALQTLVGPENFYAGVSGKDFEILQLALDILQKGAARTPPLNKTKEADAVFILGEDVTNTAPMLALNLRQTARIKAIKNLEQVHILPWNDAPIRRAAEFEKGNLFIASPCATRLDDLACGTFRAVPDDLARIGFGVASLLAPGNAPGVGDMTEEEQAVAEKIAGLLKGAERPLVVSGTGCGSRAVLEAAANICLALKERGKDAEIVLALPEANSLGLAMLSPAGGIEAAAGALGKERSDTLVILENDLFRRSAPETVKGLLEAAKNVIAIDYLENETGLRADLVLPAAAFVESSGSLVNNEGRAQRFFRVFAPDDPVRESWHWILDMHGAEEGLDELIAQIAASNPFFRDLASAAPGADFRLAGGKIPRQSHRYSGRTAIGANIDVHEPEPPEDPDSPLSFSMEGDHRQPPAALIPRFHAPGWNSIQSLNRFQQEIGGPLRGGEAGVRLIEPGGELEYFKNIPARFTPEEGRLLFVSLHHIFGSEELSALSPAVARLCLEPYVAVNPEDAVIFGVAEGDRAKVILEGSAYVLRVKVMPSLPRGTAGLPVGLSGGPVAQLPTAGDIIKEGSDE